jgi:cobyric acid synthase
MVIDCKDIDINSYQISDEEYISYFSKCKEHCKGCMNENTGLCSDMDIIDCYLHSLLPNGIWHKAVTNSLMTKNAKDISKEINKQIITKLTSISK